jgi:hypothetical protein
MSDEDLFSKLAALPGQKAAGGRGRRSELSLWLMRNRERFAAFLAEKHPAWEDVAEVLATEGITDGSRKPVSAPRLRKTWTAINRELGAAPAKLPKAKAGKSPGASLFTSGEAAAAASNPYNFRPSKPKPPLEG